MLLGKIKNMPFLYTYIYFEYSVRKYLFQIILDKYIHLSGKSIASYVNNTDNLDN